MSRGPANFREADMKRAIEVARKCGLIAARVEFETGRVTLVLVDKDTLNVAKRLPLNSEAVSRWERLEL